jgi:hypothetical protein
MTSDELLAAAQKQNEVMISLLARLVWTPEKITEIVVRGKRSAEAYVTAHNALDGSATVTQLASLAGVTKSTMSVTLQSWLDEGIILNIGTDSQPRYKRLMKIPEIRKKGKRDDVHDQ